MTARAAPCVQCARRTILRRCIYCRLDPERGRIRTHYAGQSWRRYGIRHGIVNRVEALFDDAVFTLRGWLRSRSRNADAETVHQIVSRLVERSGLQFAAAALRMDPTEIMLLADGGVVHLDPLTLARIRLFA